MDPIRMQMDIINMVIRADDDTLRTILAFVGKITSGKPEVNRCREARDTTICARRM